jgi:hypothetical protein
VSTIEELPCFSGKHVGRHRRFRSGVAYALDESLIEVLENAPLGPLGIFMLHYGGSDHRSEIFAGTMIAPHNEELSLRAQAHGPKRPPKGSLVHLHVCSKPAEIEAVAANVVVPLRRDS